MASSWNEPAVRAGPRWWVRGCWIVGILLFVSTLAEIPSRSALRGYDNTFNYLWLRSAMVDGDWDFRNDLAACNTLTPQYRAAALNLPPTPTGRIPNKYGVGWAVATLPFYLVADGLTAAGRRLGWWAWANDGFNPVYQITIQTGHALLALLALWLAMRVLRSWLGDDAPVEIGVLTVWAASPLLYYQTSNLSMSHGVAFLGVTMGGWGLAQGLKRPARLLWWLLAGFGFSLAAVGRFQAAIFGLFILWALWTLVRTDRLAVGRAALGLFVGAAPLIILQMLAWRVVYGQWLVFSYGAEGEGFHWSKPALAASLGSSWHGLYYWHPLLLVSTVGLIFWAWVQRGVALIAVGTFGLTVYVSASWWCWWLGSAFGNRAFDAALLPLMAGQAYLFGCLGPRGRKIFWLTCALFVGWNLYVLVLFRSGAISRNAAVTWLEMLRAAGELPTALKF